MIRVCGLTCCMLFAVNGLVLGQEAVRETTKIKATPTGTKEIRKISRIIGSNVRLQGVNNWGKVDDVILNDNGGIEYLVVAHDNQFVMMPWTAATVNYGQGFITYNVTPQAVQPLLFAPTAWPDITQPQWITQTRTVFPGVIRHDVSRPVPVGPAGTPAPPPGAVIPPPGTVVPPPGAPNVQEKVKVNERTGKVKVKEQVK